MTKIRMIAAAWLALSATGAHAANAGEKTPCLTSAEAQALFTAVAPPAIKAVTGACSASLPAGAYLRVNGDALATRYRVAALAARPAATAAIAKISGAGTVSPEMFNSFVGPMIEQMVASQIKPAVCPTVDRMAALLDPLPASNLAGLIAEILEIAGKDSKKPSPLQICKTA